MPLLFAGRRCRHALVVLLQSIAPSYVRGTTGRNTNPYVKQSHLAKEEIQRNKLPEVVKVDYLSAKQRKRLTQLIGKRKMVKCTFDNVPVTALWDTGAQATVINDSWKAEHLPNSTIRTLKASLLPTRQ